MRATLGFTLLSLGTLGAVGSSAYAAEAYPARTIRFIVPFAPGGSNDLFARLLGAHLSDRLGRPVVVDNRPGAGGTMGTDIAAKSTPDGHTLLMASAAFAFADSMHVKLPYDSIKSFIPVSKIGYGPNALVVHPGFPAKTVKELIAMAKAKPKQINFGSAGVGSFTHLGIELFMLLAGIEMAHIPYKGGFPAMMDVIAGNAHLMSATVVQTGPQIRAGKLRALATGGARRSSALPDVPTMIEAGVPGYDASNWWGIKVAAGTPASVVQRLDQEIAAILSMPEVQKRFMTDGAEIDHLGPAEYARFVANEIDRWSKVAKQVGIKPQ